MPRKKQIKNKFAIANTAVIYARYSSHNQKDESIEQQVKKCERFAEINKLEVIEIYDDRAISGKTDQRPNFQRMMRDAAKGKFCHVIAWKSNRMGRNMLDAMVSDADLRELGIKTLYVEEDFEDNAAGRFALRNMMNVNQFYSENMAEDVMRGMADNAELCKVNGIVPFGFKKGEDGRYALDPPKDEIVREIFKRVADREPFVDIYNDLNARGFKTSTNKPWNRCSFHSLLTNERFRGVYIWGDVRIEDGVPRIVDDALFYKVQEVLTTKKNARGRHRVNGDYLLTGKLFCGHCGSPMVGVSGTSMTGDLHHYYFCQKKRLEKDCEKKNVRRDWIERKVAEAIVENIMRDDVINWIADGYMEFQKRCREESLLNAYEIELADVKKAIKNLMNAIEAGIFTASTKDRMIELEDDKKRLETAIKLERAAQVEISREQIVFWIESFRFGNIDNKQYRAKLFNQFVQSVYLYDDRLKIVCHYSKADQSISATFEEIENLDANDIVKSSYTLPNGSPNSHIQTDVGVFFCHMSEDFPQEREIFPQKAESLLHFIKFVL